MKIMKIVDEIMSLLVFTAHKLAPFHMTGFHIWNFGILEPTGLQIKNRLLLTGHVTFGTNT